MHYVQIEFKEEESRMGKFIAPAVNAARTYLRILSSPLCGALADSGCPCLFSKLAAQFQQNPLSVKGTS